MKRSSYLWPFALAVIFCTGILVGTYMPKDTTATVRNASRDKINQLLDLLEQNYLDGVNPDSLMQDVVYGIVNQLDPHSVYYSETDSEEFDQSYSGTFLGIGVEYIMVEDTAVVLTTRPNSPAAKVGMKHGDRIIGVDNWTWKPNESSTLSEKLRGKSNTAVEVLFLNREQKRMRAKLTRTAIPVKSVSTLQRLPESSTFSNPPYYLKIDEFNANTYTEFIKATEALSNRVETTLVLDLRNNGGGLVDQSVKIAQAFLPKDAKVLRIENRDKQFEDIMNPNDGKFDAMRLFVLIDENTASSSEILAGALQDNDRATIVGRRSFGKGLIQNDFQFADGSSIRLTTNRYYTPSGRSIQKPYSKDYDIYNQDLNDRFAHGELYQRDSIHINDSLQFKTKGGRTVYGGGGIVPDVFVGLEGDLADDGVVFLARSSYMSHFVYSLIRKNQSMYGWTSPMIDKYVKDNPKLLHEFEEFLANNFFELNLSDADFLQHYIAAELARQLVSEEASNELLLKYDPMLKTILAE